MRIDPNIDICWIDIVADLDRNCIDFRGFRAEN